MRARLGAPKAVTAVAHKLAKIVYGMLKYGKPYTDQSTTTIRSDPTNNWSTTYVVVRDNSVFPTARCSVATPGVSVPGDMCQKSPHR